MALAKEGRLEEAALAYGDYFREHPDDLTHAHYFIQVLRQLKRFEQALALLDALLAATAALSGPVSEHMGILYALKGEMHMMRDEDEEAERMLMRAVYLLPGHPLPFNYLARLAMRRGAWDLQDRLLNRAYAMDATDPATAYVLAMARLRRGQWLAGWKLLEERWKLPIFLHQHQTQRAMAGTRWDGHAPLAGKTIYVVPEQGAGDTFQFTRYLPALAATGARVFWEPGRAELVDLARANQRALGVEMVLGVGDLMPETDYLVPLMGLPLRLKQYRPQWTGPYLTAPAPEPKATGRPRIGYVWAGNPGMEWNHWRSTPPDLWAPLLAMDAEWVELQVGSGGAYHPRDWTETANTLAGLDLLLTVDTGTAHLAGALGVPTWAMLHLQCDWRWGTDQATSLWYGPGFRLFRQTERQVWGPVFARVAEALSAWLSTCPISASVLTVTPKECSV